MGNTPKSMLQFVRSALVVSKDRRFFAARFFFTVVCGYILSEACGHEPQSCCCFCNHVDRSVCVWIYLIFAKYKKTWNTFIKVDVPSSEDQIFAALRTGMPIVFIVFSKNFAIFWRPRKVWFQDVNQTAERDKPSTMRFMRKQQHFRYRFSLTLVIC